MDNEIKIIAVKTPKPYVDGLSTTFVVTDGLPNDIWSLFRASNQATRLTKLFKDTGGYVFYPILTREKIGDLFPKDSEAGRAIEKSGFAKSSGLAVETTPENSLIVYNLLKNALCSPQL